MRILDRLVASNFLKLFVLFVIGAPLLFVIGDVTEQLDSYLDRGLTGFEVLQAYLYMMPKFILWSFPIAGLIAAVFTVHGMTVSREVMAAKAGGISFHRLIMPLVVLGAMLTGVAVWLSFEVPTTNRIAAEILRERDARRDWRTDFVYQTDDGRSLSIRRLRVPDRTIRGVTMSYGDPGQGQVLTHVTAATARYAEGVGWTFQDGFVRRITSEGEEGTWRFDQLVPRGLEERPEDLLEEPRDDELMTYGELGRLADIVRRSGGDPSPMLVDREQKLAIPVATFVIVLFGAPLATTSRRGGAAFGVGVSLGSTILYLLLFRVFGAIGESGTLSPLVAAWVPNAFFFVAAMVLLSRVRT